jgi:hypothetical protein
MVLGDLGFTSIASSCFLSFLGWIGMMAPAAAQESAYCQQVRARAASDAALLIAPRLVLQELRFPRNNQIDLNVPTGSGFQFRAGLSFSPVEFFKGLEMLDVGDAACLQHEAKVSLQDRLTYARDSARLAALQAQAEYLNQNKDVWAAIARKAADRLSRRLITLVDFTKLNQLIDGLDRKLADVEGDVSALRARMPAVSQRTLTQLTDEYAQRSARFEREAASVRKFDPWQLRVTGGLVAQAPLDWYGIAELSFSFGGLFRPAYEGHYQQARASEIATSTEELPAQVRELRAQTKIALDQAQRELFVTKRSLATITGARGMLENLEAENVQHARDALTVERYSTESDVVFLQRLIHALASAAE